MHAMTIHFYKGVHEMKEALINLLKVKSIITIILTITFCVGVFLTMIKGYELPESLIDLYQIIVVFYFGTQVGKSEATQTGTGVPQE